MFKGEKGKVKVLFRERQQTVICIVAGAMVGGFVLFRYLPLQKRIKAVEQRRAEQALVIAKASAESEQLPALEERLLKLRSTVGNYGRQVPEDRNLGGFLHGIADLMNKHNLREQLIQPGKETEAAELNCIPVNVQCRGRLKRIFEFYKSLQGLDRLVRIEQVKLTNDSDFTGEVKVQTKAVIYYRAQAGQAPAGNKQGQG